MVDLSPDRSRRTTSLLLSSALLLSYAVSGVDALSKEEWRSRSIYQVVTDRFATTNGSTPACPPLGRYCGGSWGGIVKKLDYIQGMGFDAIWISPIASQIDVNGPYGQAYHGYWPGDVTGEKMTDSPEELMALSKAIHDRGMALMVDVVMNHVAFDAHSAPGGDNNAVFDPTIGQSGPFATNGVYGALNGPDYFHPAAKIDLSNETSTQQGWLSWPGAVQLADIKTENDHVRKLLYDRVKKQVDTYKIDGLRLDAARHVDKAFWTHLGELNTFTIAEVFDGDANYVKPFQSETAFDSVLNFPLYYDVTRSFTSATASFKGLIFMIGEMAAKMADTSVLGGFVSNHDVPRARSRTTDDALLANMFTYSFVADGVPIWYYGDEQGGDGVEDPKNREALWELGKSAYNVNSDLYVYVKKLNAIRKAAGAFSSSFYTDKNSVVTSTDNDIVLRKGPLLSVLTNRSAKQSGTSKLTVKTSYNAGTVVVDALTCIKSTVDAKKQLSVTIQGGRPQVFLPLSAIKSSSGFCSNLAGKRRID